MPVEDLVVKKAPPTAFYVPDFISEDEEQYLLGRVENAPKPKWEQLSHRRLQNWGGALGKKGLIVDNELPDWLRIYVDKIVQLPGSLFPETKRPNHVLVNEYLPGQGIMPHTDGPMYFPVVATISLGGHIALDLYSKDHISTQCGSSEESSGSKIERRRIGSLLLERRSLVMIKDDLYTEYLHGIDERTEDLLTDDIWNLDQCAGRSIGDSISRAPRVSLTIRNVPKVTYLSKILFK